ncbi:sigma-54 interaction domain-containing protein [Hahella ganghwensis]|uniref:sigma-54 interaction domain-containing protein n=1 Tax=Hahella ganghwensis TaxID=286420 RepID=UPI000376F705|nr:sigma-54 dependent transcriptional regulator [Hahella ganghwensis]
MVEASSDVAIIEVTDFDEGDHLKLLDTNLATEIDFIFISDGEPNPSLDKTMLRCAGYHYRQPVDLERVNETLLDIHEYMADSKSHAEPCVTSDLDQFGLLVGSSGTMRKLYRSIRRVAQTEANIFIEGESGSGKELAAHTLHLASPRADKPFIAINCGALSPELIDSELFGHRKGAFTGAHRDHRGVFEQAAEGTLFLDEVTEMPLDHQVKLLRVLETGEFRPVGDSSTKLADVRVIAATNRNPLQAIADDVFREDLYFRLAHFPLKIPPLRHREDDIVGLANHFLAYRNAQEEQHKSLSPEALELIRRHPWPGNVRELKHAIERAYILADDRLLPEHLSLEAATDANASDIPFGVPLEEIEKTAILKTLEQTDGNKTECAQLLGISVKTLYNKLEKYQQPKQE